MGAAEVAALGPVEDEERADLGQRPPESIPPLYRDALALVTPSVCYEVFPLVVLEAFKEATPIIARRLGPYPEIVDQTGGGLLFHDPASLQRALTAVASDAALRARLATTDCVVFGSDLRVHVAPTGLYTYPDVAVGCGRLEFGPRDRDALTNPISLVEVLSPSTESYDRGAKFAHYRRIPSLRDYVLVAQDERRVEVFHRTSDGTWAISDPVTAGTVALPGLGIELSVDEVYAKTERFDEPTPG